MARSFFKKIYIGAINERDCEIFDQIKDFSKSSYNIKFVNLLEKDRFSEKFFLRQLKKYPISLLLLKVYSKKENKIIYQSLIKHTSNIPMLNSIKAVKTCESRRNTFELIKRQCTIVRIPEFYSTLEDALIALMHDKKIIIKLDLHNAKNVKKEDRIIGVVSTEEQLLRSIRLFNVNDLFFQEYLGKIDIVYKVYVIDHWIVSIMSTNRLLENEILTHFDLVHIRTTVDDDIKKQVLELGNAFGMKIYGIDYVLKNNQPYIVDVNDFPSFKKIPEAVSLISDHIYNFLSLRNEKLQPKVRVKI